jgi:hypothetical protein
VSQERHKFVPLLRALGQRWADRDRSSAAASVALGCWRQPAFERTLMRRLHGIGSARTLGLRKNWHFLCACIAQL